MSKNPNNQNNSNQKQDKSFSIWNLFNSKNKNCDTKNCDDENCNSHQQSAAVQCRSLKLSNNLLRDNLTDTNSLSKRILFVRDELIELVNKNLITYPDFKLIIFKTIDLFGLKSTNEQFDNLKEQLINDQYKQSTLEELHQFKILMLRIYVKLIDKQFDLLEEEVRKILFFILTRCVPFERPINLVDDKLVIKFRNELNDHSLDLMNSLTKDGKNICLFRFKIDKFMLKWFDDFLDNNKVVTTSSAIRSELTSKYFLLLNNLIRFNASAFVETICRIVEKTNQFFLLNYELNYQNKEISLCLELYDIIFRYSVLPTDVLNHYLKTLCIAVNYDNLNDLSWKILRNLINTDLSYTVLNCLLDNLEDEIKNDTIDKTRLLITCGSIYFITNSVYNEETKVTKFKHQPPSILSTLSRLLNKENLKISIHIAKVVKQLIETQALKLENNQTKNEHEATNRIVVNLDYEDGLLLIYWEHVWHILQQLNDLCNKQEIMSDNNYDKLIKELDIIITIIEKLFLNYKQFNCDEKTFNFLCSYTNLQMRIKVFENEYPPFLVQRLNHLIDNYEKIINSNFENWLQSLIKVMNQGFKNNLDTNLRIKTLNLLERRLKINTEKDEELIIDKIVIPYLKDVDQEFNFKVRDQILRFLIKFLRETSNNLLFLKVLEIISRILKKTLSRSRNNSDTSNDSSLEEDPNLLIVNGLMNIFETKIYEKNYHTSIEIFKLLSNYVCSHYIEGNNFEKISYNMRFQILEFFFKIKTNIDGYIGCFENRFSKFLRCRKSNQIPRSPSIQSTNSFQFTNLPVQQQNQFSYEEMFNYLNIGLSKERDWKILSVILDNLPAILSNPNIVYSCPNYEQIIKQLCENCLELSKKFANLNQNQTNYINLPKNIKSADLLNYVFLVLTSLIAYRDCIKPDIQISIVTDIRSRGLNSKESMQQCLICLTICATEFQGYYAISKDLPHILSTLSKTTASSQFAIPKLEFLSVLNLWPNLYSSFVSNEFLSIFAIILPYTNRMKFDEYSVALAYRVATMWYLSSRYQFRKTITDYIIKQLPENIKFSHKQSRENIYTEEYRKRSSSLNNENELNKKLIGISNSSLANTANNSNNLHNSPSLPSPVLAHQNSAVFNFPNVNQDKTNQIPISPNAKQLQHHQSNQQQQIELLHSEYVESFIDLMSRNVVCGCSTLPNQDPIGKFLLENGLSETWIYGNKLITITTSSCNSKAVKGGELCENCFNKLNAFENKFTNNNNNDDDVFNESTNNQNTGGDPNNSTTTTTTTDSTNSNKFNLNSNSNDFLSRRRHHTAYIPTANTANYRRLTSRDDSQIENNTHMFNLCRSFAAGWAEILIRTPTGTTSWITKLQNSLTSNFQLNEMADLLPNYSLQQDSTSNQNQNRLSQINEQQQPTYQSTIRGRSNTISTSSDKSIKRLSNSLLINKNENDLKLKNKMQPSFVFLQFFHSGTFGSNREPPILLPKGTPFENTLRVFDRISPSETYKVGIIYVGKNQMKDRKEVLSNEYGSERYMNFVKRIGTLVRLSEIDSQKIFIGGLSQGDGTDGDFACIHQENLTQVVFHVATFMPNKENDPKCNDKMRHIGNNHVCIVYNDSEEEFDFSLMKGQWLKACIIITPNTNEMNFVHIETIPELENLNMYKKPLQVTISDQNIPYFVRQLSITTSLFSLVYQFKGQNFSTSFLSNWVNRIKKIKDIKEKVKNYTDMTISIKNPTNSSNGDISSLNDQETINFPLNFTNFIT